MRSSTTDIGAGAFSLAVALVFFTQLGELEGVGLLYPQLIVGFITLGGAVLLGLGMYKIKTGRNPNLETEPIAFKRVGIILGLSIAYVAAVGLAGFYLSSAVFLFTSSMVLNDMGLGPRKAAVAGLLLTVVMCLAVWICFTLLLNVPTPEGIWDALS